MQMLDTRKTGNILFRTATVFSVIAGLFALGAIAYLGTFTRYMADDYCESNEVSKFSSPMDAVVNRYLEGGWRAANRYSNLLFVGLADVVIGESNVQILPVLMLFLWVISATWVAYEIRRLAGREGSILVDCFLAASLIFLSMWQAPSLFQTFFWRSSMATHFVPLVFLTLLGGFLLRQIRFHQERTPPLWICLIVFAASFLIGGFSEPPNTFAIAALSLLLIYTWRWARGSATRPAVHLQAWTLAGMVVSFLVMFLSPANRLNSSGASPDILSLVGRTFKFTYEFIWDTVLVLPVPTMVSILILALFMLCTYPYLNRQSSPETKRRLWMWIVLIPLIHYLLIAASFAPSAYGQSYPVDRARFLGRLIMTAALMLEGAMLGALIAQSGMFISRRRLAGPLIGILFLVLAIYPLRAGFLLLGEAEDYRQWATAWDAREAEIRQMIASGEQDLVVRLLPGWQEVKEIDGDPGHWVNLCAAEYYGVNSIRSVPMGDP